MKPNELGCVHVYTGEGKGKTSSAMGLATRAHGRGYKVKIVQFFKRNTGEQKTFQKLDIPYTQFSPLHPYFKDYDDPSFVQLREDFHIFWTEQMKDVLEGVYDVVILDEVGPALAWNVCKDELVLDLLKKKPKGMELVLTGRGMPTSVKEEADYVTEMQMVKHPYEEKGIQARIGIEY